MLALKRIHLFVLVSSHHSILASFIDFGIMCTCSHEINTSTLKCVGGGIFFSDKIINLELKF